MNYKQNLQIHIFAADELAVKIKVQFQSQLKQVSSNDVNDIQLPQRKSLGN